MGSALANYSQQGNQKRLTRKSSDQHQDKLSTESKAKVERQQAEKKYALQTMMKLEQEERESIQKIKESLRQKTTAELETWQQKQKDIQIEKHSEIIQVTAKQSTQREVCEAKARSDFTVKGGLKSRTQQEELPALELAQEQAEARRASSDTLEDLKDLQEEQRNPDWLKDKGDKCFAIGDYQGAVNAYSLAIKLNRKLPALFSNRAACHLKLRNLHKAIEDSSQALELLTPAVPANAAARPELMCGEELPSASCSSTQKVFKSIRLL
ncbi:hypothetical protein WMY93_023970 [Mugilogobius chulae]|uniref:Uncharacterized protein n=1 Tax=Mugilogobius chulae TaxID=88201 RepID=A0AAW0NI06_9GOBI